MKKRFWSMLLIGILAIGCCACGTDDAVDQAANVVQAEDENVLSVKNGTNSNYPGTTYGEAFEAFFGNPAWKYFKGTQEGPDDDGDGKPDYTKEDIDVVEFTGYCTYSDVKVKALIQFILDKDAGTFEAGFLSFNKVPQTSLTLSALIDKAFETYLGETETAESSQLETMETETTEKNEKKSLYPEGMNFYSENIDPTEIAGSYTGTWGQSYAEINIYSSSEGDTVGNADVYLDSEMDVYGGNEYTGDLVRIDKNLYSLKSEDNKTILIGVDYDEADNLITLEVWIDKEKVETFYMSEHYES